MTSGSEVIQTTFKLDSLSAYPDIDPQRVAAAKRIIDGGTCKVYKSTRSGLSTSAVIAGTMNRKRILFVAPTNRILNRTVSDASLGNLVQVLPNSFCLRLEESIKQDRFLAKLPTPLPKCEECKSFRACPVTQILDSNKPVITITYHKLEALMLSKSRTAKKIIAKLSSVDVVLLDEAHTISLPNVVRVPASSEVEIPSQYPRLLKIQQNWFELNGEQSERINLIADEGKKGHVGKHLSKIFPNKNPLNFRRVVAACNDLFDLATHRKEFGIQDMDILLLRDLILLMSSNWLNISYVTEKGGKEGNVYLTGNYWTAIRALSMFLTEHARHAVHLYISGTLIEPDPNFFSELSGKEVNDVVFPDIKNTNDKMVIYPDTWRLSAQNFKKNLPRIIDRVVVICKENPEEGVFVVVPTARMAKTIHKRLAKVIGEAAPLVDYYRSDETMGVENSARICIAIGSAELPSNVYDHLARGGNEDEKWVDSQRLRQESVDAATWQTWSRVKDPEGKKGSRVYCIGVREDRIVSVVCWGPGRRLDVERIKSYKLPDGISGRIPIFKTIVSEPIKPPRIANGRSTLERGRARGNIKDSALSVENYDSTLIISEFENILPIINNRQNLNKLGNYNNPQDDFEVEVSAAILTSLLATRFDCYAVQDSIPDASGRYNYCKCQCPPKVIPMVMKRHVKGEITIGLYQVSLEDTVKWVCFDIDDHKGERGAEAVEADVRKLLAVLSKHGIPFLLEASGSPNSYHVWILLKPTKTYHAYLFSRKIKSEADIECEVFPKQKSLNKDSKYGNLVKVPLGINRKTGVRSQFLDPNTFEPYSGLVPIPGIVQLHEQDDAESETRTLAVRGDRKQAGPVVAPANVGGDLRPCMKELLESSTLLEGSEGHTMRAAIASEARNIGLTIE